MSERDTDERQPRSRGENSTAIDAGVVERVAAEVGVDEDELADALVVLGADLTGSQRELEQSFEHATVDGRRVYAADDDTWVRVLERNEVDELAGAVRTAHAEQADALVGDAETPLEPLVVGVDTAEEGGSGDEQIPDEWRG